MSKTVLEIMTYQDCKEKVDIHSEDFFSKACGALACIFDVDWLIVKNLVDLGCINFAMSPNPQNYIQLLHNHVFSVDHPIDMLLSYLFNMDPDKEWMVGDESQRNLINTFYVKIITDYKSINSYFKQVSERLWMDKSFLAKKYPTHFYNAACNVLLFAKNKCSHIFNLDYDGDEDLNSAYEGVKTILDGKT
jgi:hypothetical protein